MKILVVSDQGRIVALGKMEDVGALPSGIVNFGVTPGKGQRVDSIQVPRQLRHESLTNLHTKFHLELRGKRVRLVPGDGRDKGKSRSRTK